MSLEEETDQVGLEGETDQIGLKSTSTAEIENNILLGSRCTNVSVPLSTSTLQNNPRPGNRSRMENVSYNV